MRKLFLCAVLLCSFSAWGQLPDCSKGFCAGIGSPMSPHIPCKAGNRYSQLDAPGTGWSCTGVPPDWVKDAGGLPLALVPAENFGAVGDWNGTTGTDNTTALQNAINSLQTAGTCGQVLLQAKSYKITGTLSITSSCVGIKGTSPVLTNTSFYTTPPASVIISTSASADILDVAGVNTSNNITYNEFQDFTLARSQIPTGSAAGFSLKYSYGVLIQRVTVEDSIYGFYLTGDGGQGIGAIENSAVTLGFNGFVESGGTYYGIYIDGTIADSPSLRIRHSLFANNAGGTTTNGLYTTGAHINDLMVYGWETATASVGINVNGTPGGDALDIHFYGSILDTCQVACIEVNNLPAGGAVEINGGYAWGGSDGVYIAGSTGVTVSNMQITNQSAAAIATSSSTDISLVGNNINAGGTEDGIVVIGGSNVAATGNTIVGAGVPRGLLRAVSPAAHLTFTGNNLDGTGAAGVDIESGTTDVQGVETNTYASTLTAKVVSTIPFLIPPIGSETVTFSATPTFSNITRASIITLTGNVTSFTLAAGVDGQQKTLTFCQDSTGSRTVAAPANVHGFTTIGSTLSKCSQQSYTYSAGQSAWLANAAGVINQ